MTTSTATSENIRTGIIWFDRYWERVQMARNKSFFRKNKKYFLILFVLSILAVITVQFGPRYVYRFFGYLWLEKFESHLTENQINAIQKGLQGLKAKIVWSSSRTGNHEIFMVTLPDLKMVQITHSNHVNFFPSFFSGRGKDPLLPQSTALGLGKGT